MQTPISTQQYLRRAGAGLMMFVSLFAAAAFTRAWEGPTGSMCRLTETQCAAGTTCTTTIVELPCSDPRCASGACTVMASTSTSTMPPPTGTSTYTAPASSSSSSSIYYPTKQDFTNMLYYFLNMAGEFSTSAGPSPYHAPLQEMLGAWQTLPATMPMELQYRWKIMLTDLWQRYRALPQTSTMSQRQELLQRAVTLWTQFKATSTPSSSTQSSFHTAAPTSAGSTVSSIGSTTNTVPTTTTSSSVWTAPASSASSYSSHFSALSSTTSSTSPIAQSSISTQPSSAPTNLPMSMQTPETERKEERPVTLGCYTHEGAWTTNRMLCAGDQEAMRLRDAAAGTTTTSPENMSLTPEKNREQEEAIRKRIEEKFLARQERVKKHQEFRNILFGMIAHLEVVERNSGLSVEDSMSIQAARLWLQTELASMDTHELTLEELNQKTLAIKARLQSLDTISTQPEAKADQQYAATMTSRIERVLQKMFSAFEIIRRAGADVPPEALSAYAEAVALFQNREAICNTDIAQCHALPKVLEALEKTKDPLEQTLSRLDQGTARTIRALFESK